jgi:hypothetical protein
MENNMTRSEVNFIVSQYGMRVNAVDFRDCIEKMDADTSLSVIEQEAYKRMVYMLIDEAEERA